MINRFIKKLKNKVKKYLIYFFLSNLNKITFIINFIIYKIKLQLILIML